MNDYEAGVIAAVVLVLAVLVYRLLRHEPFDRIVRLGLFIERQRYEPPLDDEPADPDATEEWPQQRDPPV